MTLLQLRYIIVISETGSMNKAAEQLYLSQPSLTAAVKELERELDINLQPRRKGRYSHRRRSRISHLRETGLAAVREFKGKIFRL